MNRLKSLTKSFIQEQDGAVVTEYGMLIVIVVLGLSVVLVAFRGRIGTWFNNIATNLEGLDSQ